MNLTDILALAWRNLRQAKLRTALTVMGVLIGVAAIITMVSFGIGLQQNIVANAFAKFDLFTLITVFGPSADALLEMSGGDQTEREPAKAENENGREAAAGSPARVEMPRRVLDDEAIAQFRRLSYVKYAQPVIAFQSYVRFDGRTRRYPISGAPAALELNPRFKKFISGHSFSSDDATEVIVTENFLYQIRTRQRLNRSGRPAQGPFRAAPDKSETERAQEASQALGKEVTLLTLRGSTAAPASVFGIPLLNPGDEAGEAEDDSRFERHVFRIVGVLASEGGFNVNALMETDLYVPIEQAKRFREANRAPMEQVSEALVGDAGYQRAEVRVTDPTQVRAVQDEIKKLGFNSFSLNNQVDEIRRVFLIINGGLALIGGIALLVASFGIANTMIMSILERTREIGIMKAIGGSDGEIMRIFFFEASLIGLAGGASGVIAGWVIDRVANFLVNRWVVKQTPDIEFFSIPWYLWGGAILFAILVSLVAAIYPALRAARVDPIKALRHD
jgi:putative ABC transport system permease protein